MKYKYSPSKRAIIYDGRETIGLIRLTKGCTFITLAKLHEAGRLLAEALNKKEGS